MCVVCVCVFAAFPLYSCALQSADINKSPSYGADFRVTHTIINVCHIHDICKIIRAL